MLQARKNDTQAQVGHLELRVIDIVREHGLLQGVLVLDEYVGQRHIGEDALELHLQHPERVEHLRDDTHEERLCACVAHEGHIGHLLEELCARSSGTH